jgi:hypothetical protein
MRASAGWVLAAWLAAASVAACNGCARDEAGSSSGAASGSAKDGSAAAEGEGAEENRREGDDLASARDDGSAATASGGREARPACTGTVIDVFDVLADPRCAITAREARRLRAVADDAGAGAHVVQRASAEEDGTVTVRLVNTGPRAVTVPLFDDPRLPAFTALAQDPAGALVELEPPARAFAPPSEPQDGGRADDASGGSDASGRGDAERGPPRPRLARARLVPGAAIVVHLLPSARVVRRLSPPCPDGGRCGPAVLAPGAYVLHVGQLLADLEAGPPARVAFLFR